MKKIETVPGKTFLPLYKSPPPPPPEKTATATTDEIFNKLERMINERLNRLEKKIDRIEDRLKPPRILGAP
jgi:hypothetical protein